MLYKIKKITKWLNFCWSYLVSFVKPTTFFVRIIPTDACNLRCSYCWQRKDNSQVMTIKKFKNILDRATKLKVGLISFLGGEPMTWNHIYEAIHLCTEKNILTDMTTNGTLLDSTTIKQLGVAGLDYLNISVDSKQINSVSAKNSIFKNNLVNILLEGKKRHGIHIRLNAVLYNNNFEDIKELIEFSEINQLPISIGYLVPPFTSAQIALTSSFHDNQLDRDILKKIITYLSNKIDGGYPIVDPKKYFENIFKFLKNEKFWNCNYPSRFGWINVTPNGKIRSCTKKMDELDMHFTDLTTKKISELRALYKTLVKKCNHHCYSNCAFDSYYFAHHKIKFFIRIIRGLK